MKNKTPQRKPNKFLTPQELLAKAKPVPKIKDVFHGLGDAITKLTTKS